jgi:hypothetical protein
VNLDRNFLGSFSAIATDARAHGLRNAGPAGVVLAGAATLVQPVSL